MKKFFIESVLALIVVFISFGMTVSGLDKEDNEIINDISSYEALQKAAEIASKNPNCGINMFVDINTETCFPVYDDDYRFDSLSIPANLPDLAEMRFENYERMSFQIERLPFPQLLACGAGVTYKSGMLRVNNSSNLVTEMYVRPEGLGNLNQGRIFTTATNRTDCGVEVLSWYAGPNSPEGYKADFGIYDWSLNNCQGSGWVYVRRLSDVPCFYVTTQDARGHTVKRLTYQNLTEKVQSGNPPKWRNRVIVYNWCYRLPQIVYEHTYFANQRDCSVGTECGWWGPILEPQLYDCNALPQIREVGFNNSFIQIDGIQYQLTSSNTIWNNPNSTWIIFHRTPNYEFGIGNFVN